MNKTTLTSLAILIILNPSIAFACLFVPPPWILIGVPIVHFMPVIIGNMIVGKGTRLWFTGISVFYYFAMYAILNGLNIIQSDSNFLTMLLLPYVLIIVALIKRGERKNDSIQQ